jgi:hypothetical protein
MTHIPWVSSIIHCKNTCEKCTRVKWMLLYKVYNLYGRACSYIIVYHTETASRVINVWGEGGWSTSSALKQLQHMTGNLIEMFFLV